MSRRTLVLLLALVCAGCKQQAPKQTAAPAAGPQVRATVVTIRTTLEPDKQTHTHTLVIGGGRARSTNEQDRWRLFDTKAKTVTYVDDVAKTIRTESLDALLKKHREALGEPLPPHYPRAYVKRTGEKRPMQGATAEQVLIDVGGYRRELWLAEHPAIPDGLFAMMQASDGASSPLAPMMRAAGDVLTLTRAFPLLDHSEVTVGDKKRVTDRAVIGIAERNVSEAMLSAPRGYRDLTPKPAAPK